MTTDTLCLTLLLENDSCDPNQKNARNDTALHIACEHGKERVVELLLEKGAAPIHVVKNTHCLQLLLENKRCNPNAPNAAGDTALHMACMHRNFPAVKLLLDHEANVLAINSKGDAPIHKTFDIDCLNLLIGSKHCDPNQQNANGDTALHIACMAANKGSEYAYKAVRTLLCAQNIDPECVNHNSETPIEVAGTHYEIIKMISNLSK